MTKLLEKSVLDKFNFNPTSTQEDVLNAVHSLTEEELHYITNEAKTLSSIVFKVVDIAYAENLRKKMTGNIKSMKNITVGQIEEESHKFFENNGKYGIFILTTLLASEIAIRNIERVDKSLSGINIEMPSMDKIIFSFDYKE